MNPLPSSERDEQDGDKLLKALGALQVPYPVELLAARRVAFLAQLERLITPEPDEVCSTADQEIVSLLGVAARSTRADYPAHLLAARHSAFIRRIESAGRISPGERIRGFLQKLFQTEKANPNAPPAGFMRLSFIVATLVAALFLGSVWFAHAQASFTASISQAAVTPTAVLPTRTSEAALSDCTPNDRAAACLPGELDPGQDLADPGNGAARLAVSNDTQPAHQAKYVNDGRGGTSWVSNSADSWIKLDLGQVRTINTVSLEKGFPVSARDNDLGSFVIAVALSDVYADGDSRNDYREYAQVFQSEQASSSGVEAHTAMITTHFSPVEARFVKITFKRAGAAVEEVRVFMVEPPVLSKQPARIPDDNPPGIPSISTLTNTGMAADPASSAPADAPTNTPTNTPDPADTATPLPTDTQPPTMTSVPSDTPTALPSDTPPPVDTSTPVTIAPLPTLVPPTAIAPADQLSYGSSEPIVVTGSNQTLTFTCTGNAVEIRGHANMVTLLGFCSSITVTGNGNGVFWQFGAPVITTQGQDNLVRQL